AGGQACHRQDRMPEAAHSRIILLDFLVRWGVEGPDSAALNRLCGHGILRESFTSFVIVPNITINQAPYNSPVLIYALSTCPTRRRINDESPKTDFASGCINQLACSLAACFGRVAAHRHRLRADRRRHRGARPQEGARGPDPDRPAKRRLLGR